MRKVTFVPVLLGVLVGAAGGQNPEGLSLEVWGQTLGIDPRIVKEVQKFEDGGSLAGPSALAFVTAARSQLFASAERVVLNLRDGECSAFIHVSIGDSDSLLPPDVGGAEKEAWQKFEASLIRTEMVACLDTGATDAREVLDLYTSPEFRMTAESRIVNMWEDQEGACMETKGVLSLVDPTRLCNQIRDFRSEDVAAEHSQVVFNEGRKPYQDVYFKESLKTFVRIPGGMALHYVNYSRAGNLGRIERWAGPGQIRGSQEGTVEEFQRWLRTRFRSIPRPVETTGVQF
jgi:hypothetical protein